MNKNRSIRSHLWLIHFAFVLLILLVGCTKEPSNPLTFTSQQGVIELVRSEMAWQSLNSVAFAVVKNDEIIWSDAFGFADRKKEIHASTDTRYLIASISKTITTVALLTLVESGQIDLDEDINTYLNLDIRNPQFPNQPITVRMLLNHSSSISDENFLRKDLFCFGFDCPGSLEDFIHRLFQPSGDLFSTQNFFGQAPGIEANYCNINFAVAGLIVEKVSGMDFDSYTKEKLFQPLGMTKSEWFLKNTPQEELALTYSLVYQGSSVNPHISFMDYPAGSLRSTVHDISAFLRMLMMEGEWNGEQILNAELLEIMKSPEYRMERGGLIFDYGLGIYFRQFGRHRLLGHGGGEQGITSEMVFDPNNNVGVVVFTNTTSIVSLELITQALIEYGIQQNN